MTTSTADQQLHVSYIRRCLDLARLSPPKPTNFRVGSILLYRRARAQSLTPATAQTTTTPNQSAEAQGPQTLSPGTRITSDAYDDVILSTGYTLELEGNTHAEQCCFTKYAASHGVPESEVGSVLPPSQGEFGIGGEGVDEGQVVLYVTMEPCGRRLSGNDPCAKRIARTRTWMGAEGGDTSTSRGSGVDKVYFGVKEPGTFVGQSIGCQLLDDAGVDWELVQGLEREILDVAMEGHEKKPGEEEMRRAEATRVDNISAKERKRQEETPRNPMKRMMEEEV